VTSVVAPTATTISERYRELEHKVQQAKRERRGVEECRMSVQPVGRCEAKNVCRSGCQRLPDIEPQDCQVARFARNLTYATGGVYEK